MSDSRNIDEQSRRVIREELLNNILVEAGAGSGKTQMLAERMAAGVASGVYQVEQMAAVTFTRKAASELRGRFHLALEKHLAALCRAGSSDPANAAQIERIRGALSNLERFFTGTIHSFCARLLRERPVESGVSPGFTELDEVQDFELRKRAWRDFIASARTAGDPDMMALLEADVKPKDLDSAFATISLHEDVEFPAGDAERPDPKAARKALEKFWKELQKHLPATIDSKTTCPIQKAARTFRGQLNVSRYRLDRPSVIASLLETWGCESKIVQKWWAESAAEKRRFRDLINPLHADFCSTVAVPYLSQWRQHVYRLSVTLLTRARENAARERRRLNSLNYGDLLNLTARVLRENRQVRRALQEKYRHLFVDEFQDTDPVQAEIVFLLAGDEDQSSNVARGLPPSQLLRQTDQSRATGVDVANSSSARQAIPKRTADREPRIADWRQVRLRPGALFVVGDPKQSIYRFRRADIDIYNTVRERFGDTAASEGDSNSSGPDGVTRKRTADCEQRTAVGRVISLTRNFRSVPQLCAWANDVFKTRFPTEPSQHSPRFAALDPNDDRGSGSRAADTVGVLTLTHTCDEARDVLTEDADKIARYIRSEVDANRRKFSDFLILTRKKRDRIAPYAAALEQLNIPIEVSGAGAFGKSAEVDALTILLRSLADPQDTLALVAVLRGPLFGISDPDLFAFKQAGGWFSVFYEAGAEETSAVDEPDVVQALSPAPANTVSASLAALRQYWRWTRVLPAAAALERILEHTGYLALAATTQGGVEAGDLLHAVDRVRRIVEEGGSLSDAADALEDDSDESSEVESLPLEPGRTDVVRIMNLHKAKGLEADVVFLADPCGGMRPRVDVHIARTDQQPQGWFQIVRKSETSYATKLLGEHADWAKHEAAEMPYLQHEVDRLLYVAATRARHTLVVSRWTGTKGTPAWGVLNEFLTGSTELKVPKSVLVAAVKPLDCSTALQAEAHALRTAAHERVRQASWSITSATAEAKHIAKMTRISEAAADDPTGVVRTDTATHRSDAGMAWGTLIHGLLEHAMRHPNSTADDLRRLGMWLTVDEPQLRSVLDDAIEMVQRVGLSDFWREAKASEHSEEAPFAVADAGALINGVIDLLFDSAQGWQVRDYKTDLNLDANAYERQLESYRDALRKVGCDAAGAALVHVRDEHA